MFYFDTAVYGGKWYATSGHWSFFPHFLEALNDAFEVQIFSRLHFYALSKTLIACKAMQLRLF